MSAKRQNTRNPFMRRPSPQSGTGKTILIVTEGAKTEPQYLQCLREKLKLMAADIRITKADGTDPVSVVNDAIRLRNERKREARRSYLVEYDSVWAVFDTERIDTNELLNDACQRAKANKINIALSNPCFEYWLLLHYEYTTKQFIKCANVIRHLKDEHLSNYDKGNYPVEQFISRISTAVKYSEQCRRHHASVGGDRNPSTDVDLLVREMNAATRLHNRIKLEN